LLLGHLLDGFEGSLNGKLAAGGQSRFVVRFWGGSSSANYYRSTPRCIVRLSSHERLIAEEAFRLLSGTGLKSKLGRLLRFKSGHGDPNQSPA
jgi:hypothetical protein